MDRVTAAILERDGYVMRDVLVVRFLDDEEGRRWFLRKQETVAYVQHPFDGPDAWDERELLSYVREHFGPDVYAVY